MGSSSRVKPEKLGGKLMAIRLKFEYTFSEMAECLSDDKVKVLRTDVSRFEKGFREPSLIILLRYAKLAHTTLDILADDEIKFLR